MKKIITILAIIAMFGFQGCEGPEGPPGPAGQDAIMPVAFELKNVNLVRITDNNYELKRTFASTQLGGDLFDDETVLVYRMTGTVNSSTPIWQLIPRTIYNGDGTKLVYDYDFSKVDFIISAFGDYTLSSKPEFINNQTFRIVVSPSDLIASVNKNDYNAVINALNINESKIQKIDIQ